MTVLIQSFPTRKHCQRAALLHHTPADLRVRLLGLCTKGILCIVTMAGHLVIEVSEVKRASGAGVQPTTM